ncbi:hypothetical protein [Shewanella sp. NIFS-20-20]|uniref:hypothetical protein n=1 Tax=Shewanella sp. NIFS-20-20 TaxID=2853806 RepID=UPI001C48742E|nr:hypothetical protein [Shewanella sp. NIFS-20-20]MBV7314462.1 hypothetical protein [Shewanella sp. NIFS-20-20]
MTYVSNILRMAAMATLLIMTSAAANAEASRTLQASYPFQGQEVLLDIGVGSVKVMTTDEPIIRVEVEVKAAETGWFSWGDVDLEYLALAPSQSAHRLALSLNEQDDINQHWLVYLPKEAAVEIDFGVGEVLVTGIEGDLRVDLGVGNVGISHQHHYQDIDLDAGVGEVTIFSQGHALETNRSLVSQSYAVHQQGQGELTVKVGVGEIMVRQHY